MKQYLIILYSKSIDGTLFVQVQSNTVKNIVDKAIDKLYQTQYEEQKESGYNDTFRKYVDDCLQNDGLCHVATIEDPKKIINAEYFYI
jgi:hypothetical protein